MRVCHCRPESKGKGGSNGPTPKTTPKTTPQNTPRGLGSTWGQAIPVTQTPKGIAATVKTALQDMKQVWDATLPCHVSAEMQLLLPSLHPSEQRVTFPAAGLLYTLDLSRIACFLWSPFSSISSYATSALAASV